METSQILQRITITSPCTADWNTMSGDDRARLCGECQRTVYNITAMSESEAEELIRETEGRLCARIFRRADETILTQDCLAPSGSSKPNFVRRGFQYSLSSLCLLTLICATCLGVVRVIPASWIEAMRNWADPPEVINQPAPVFTKTQDAMALGEICIDE